MRAPCVLNRVDHRIQERGLSVSSQQWNVHACRHLSLPEGGGSVGMWFSPVRPLIGMAGNSARMDR
jgi:hypothetical protein